MAAESEFDIDEVLDWDKRDYPSKDLEFQEITGLDIPSEVATPSQPTSQSVPSSAPDNLVLANQLLRQQQQQQQQQQHRNAVQLPSQKQGTAIVRMQQMSNTPGLLDPVFPVDGPMISDIRQELMHSHALGRSGTPPTPTFPSENFDLPPLTPPASTGSNMSAAFPSLGHSGISARMTSHLINSGEARPRQPAPRVMQSFGQGGMVQLPQQRPSISSPLASMPLAQPIPTSDVPMEEGSIEQLLDEIVERDMPQGVNEPIVFASEVPEHSTAEHMPTKAMQPSTRVPKSGGTNSLVHHAPMHMAASPQSSATIGLRNSPINQTPASPVAPARTPSPNIQVHQKAGIQLRQAPTQMPVSSSLGLAQSVANTVRTSTGQATSSQITQQPSNQASDRLSPAIQSGQLGTPGRSIPHSMPGQANLQAGTSVGSSGKVQWSSQNVPQMSNQAKIQTNTSLSNVNLKLIQGGSVLPIRIQGNAQSLPGLKLGPAINDPAVLQQIMKAVAPSGAKTPTASTQASTATTTQANSQRLIYYVMPQKKTSAATTMTETVQTSGAASSSVKMFLINADKSILSKPASVPAQAAGTPVSTRIQLPLGMTTRAKDTPSQPVQLGVKDNTPNSPKTQEKPAMGQHVPVAASIPLQNMLQKSQQDQVASSFGLSSSSSGLASTVVANDLSQGTLRMSSVPITFINEASIGQGISCTPIITPSNTVSTSQLSNTVVAASPAVQVAPSPFSNTQASIKHEESEDDDDDSRPLAQVAKNLKKTRKKGTKRKKKVKEGEEGHRPHLAYQLFFKETQAAIRQQKPTAQFDQIAKIVSHMWEELGEEQRKVYAKKARLERQEAATAEAALPKQRKPDLHIVSEAHRVPPGNSSPARTDGSPSTIPKAATAALSGVKTKKDSPLKPKKKVKSSINPISQRLCVRDGCSMPARTTKDRGTYYCSNECTVKHCSMVFKSWVEQRKAESQTVLRQAVS